MLKNFIVRSGRIMNRYYLFLTVGTLLIVIFLAVYLLTPIYAPHYKNVENTLKNNYKETQIPPQKSVIVFTLSTTQTNNTIYLISNSSTLYLQVINTSGLIANNSEVLITKVYPGNYSIVVANPTNTTQSVTVRYGIFPYSDLSSLYSLLGVVTTVSEFFIALGVVAIGYGAIALLVNKIGLSKRFKRRK